ncbi:hypothetical protein DPMN_113225 [Dreissena polymorpha]|uniref:Uncharacterized protein n=1 Tax=Dreissena polymorpha TaxID=45954 RepID=A0A9D4QQS6_DREPO|nr:hypothetical protein DPMN_113225 [Dreissena polymorpha]
MRIHTFLLKMDFDGQLLASKVCCPMCSSRRACTTSRTRTPKRPPSTWEPSL